MTTGIITDAEHTALMDAFKSALPADVVDPCSLGRIRNCTIIPLAAAATVVCTFGRSLASMAWLRALSQPIPQAWELREEHEMSMPYQAKLVMGSKCRCPIRQRAFTVAHKKRSGAWC